jgi:hypothetical protein
VRWLVVMMMQMTSKMFSTHVADKREGVCDGVTCVFMAML